MSENTTTVLSQAILDSLVGGQMEIQNPDEDWIYRGELKCLTLNPEAKKVSAKFNWMAKGVDFPPRSWKNDSNLNYVVALDFYTLSNIGSSANGGSDRWCFLSEELGVIIVIFPPDGSKLDPKRVEGLNLATA